MPFKKTTQISTKTNNAKSKTALCGDFPMGKYTIHMPNECKQVLKNRPIHLKKCTYDGKKIIHSMEKEGFRKLLLPSTEPTVYPKIISSTEFSNLLKRTHVLSKKEQEAARANAENMKERLLRESAARKEAILYMDLHKNHAKEGRVSDIEGEMHQRTTHLLDRARDMQLEQEEQIKKCNKIILETKCRAIRDAQVVEKKIMEREEMIEEQRMIELMEKERLNAIQAEELAEKQQLQQKRQLAESLKEQIIMNEQERFLEYKRKLENSRLANITNIARQEEALEKQKEKEAEQEKTRRALTECNEHLKLFKAMEMEENRVMDIRIRKFQEEKAEREAKVAREMLEEFMRREREKDRVAIQADQTRQLQAQLEIMNEARIQEEVEREWRQREKEKALQQAENLRQLRLARDQQITNKMNMQAIEIQREKQEFEKILKIQKEAVCREQKEREKKHKEALVHRVEILKQVNEKEKEKIKHRQKMFEEGLAVRAQNEMRNRMIRETIERKYQQLADNKLPTPYIKNVKSYLENIK